MEGSSAAFHSSGLAPDVSSAGRFEEIRERLLSRLSSRSASLQSRPNYEVSQPQLGSPQQRLTHARRDFTQLEASSPTKRKHVPAGTSAASPLPASSYNPKVARDASLSRHNSLHNTMEQRPNFVDSWSGGEIRRTMTSLVDEAVPLDKRSPLDLTEEEKDAVIHHLHKEVQNLRTRMNDALSQSERLVAEAMTAQVLEILRAI